MTKKKKQVCAAIVVGVLAVAALLFPAVGPLFTALGTVGQAVIAAAPTPTLVLPETGPEVQGGQDSGASP